jgi:hypothetical protein
LLAPIGGVDVTNAESLEEFAKRYRERVERALALEAATIAYEDAKYRAGVVRRRIERKQAALETRARGRDKPPRRRANRPVKVDVEEQAWQLVKRDALRHRKTVGEHVGGLVGAAVSDPVRPRHLSQRAPQRMFTRLIIDDETWGKFRVLAIDVGVSTGRLVGIIVEREARRIERGAR